MTFIHLEACLHNHHVAPELLAHTADVGYAIGNYLVGLQRGVTIDGPIGIERHAYHVELAAMLEHDSQVVVIQFGQVSAVEMDNDDGIGEDLLHSIVSSTDEAGILLGMSLDVAHRIGDGGVALLILYFPTALVGLHIPQHTVGRLVAHLHPTWLHAVFFQKGEHLDGMVAKVLLHLFIRMSHPCLGDRLLGRVGPPVAVVEVYHHVHAQLLGTQGHGKHLFLTTRTTTRIDPDAEADGRNLIIILQQLQAFALVARRVEELLSASLLSREETHVGTFYKIIFYCLVLCRTPHCQYQEKRRKNHLFHGCNV